MQASFQISAATPRTVRKTGTYFGMIISIPAVLLLALVIISAVLVPIALQERRLRDDGLDGSALVRNLFTEPGKNGPTFFVSYSYQAGIVQEAVNEKIFSHLSIGDTIPILYVTSGTRRSEININGSARTGVNYDKAVTLYEVVASIAIIPSALWFGFFWLVGNREAKLLIWGSLAAAKITSETEYKIKGARFSRLTYEFPLPPQGLVTGIRTWSGVRKGVPIKEASSLRDIALRAALTTEPLVVYDPDNPKRNALYPMTWVRLAEEP